MTTSQALSSAAAALNGSSICLEAAYTAACNTHSASRLRSRLSELIVETGLLASEFRSAGKTHAIREAVDGIRNSTDSASVSVASDLVSGFSPLG